LDDDVDRLPTKTVLRKEYRREDQYLCIEIQPYRVSKTKRLLRRVGVGVRVRAKVITPFA